MPSLLKVLLFSRHRATLRDVSQFLHKFGYEVEQCTEAARAAARLAAERPDFVLLDRPASLDACRELCRLAGGDRRHKYAYTFLISDDPRPESCAEAITAGVDDFLAYPLVYGELLARLRAGARVLEYERRVREQAGWDPLTGLLSRSSFVGRLKRELKGTAPLACALLEVDDLDVVRHAHGHDAVEELVQAVAALLDELGGQFEVLARLEGGRFAVALQGTNEAAAAEWAEQLRQRVAETQFACRQQAVRTTLCAGVAGDEIGLPDPEVLLKRASDALELAHTSGHDCVIRYGEYEQDQQRWQALAEPGKLFAGTLARHVMTPITLTVQPDEAAPRLADLFRQTNLPAIPVVDEKGRLQGLVLRKAAAKTGEQVPQRASEIMTTEITRFAEETSFAALLEHFRNGDGGGGHGGQALAVVVEGDLPTGLITRRGLASLIDPLSTATFAARLPLAPSSDYLLVPDVSAMGGI